MKITNKTNRSILIKLFVSKAFYFLDHKEFALFDHLSRIKSYRTIEDTINILEETKYSNLSTNLCLVDELEKMCFCSANSIFSNICFAPDLKENDLSSWARILSRLEEGKLRVDANLLGNRRLLQVIFDNFVHIAAGEFLRMSPNELVICCSVLKDLYHIKNISLKTISSCENNLNDCTKNRLKHSRKYKFVPQMFGTHQLDINLSDSSREFLQGMVSRFSRNIDGLTMAGIDINHNVNDNLLEAINGLKDVKVTMEHGLDDTSKDVLNHLIDVLQQTTSSVTSSFESLSGSFIKYLPIILIGLIIYIYPRFETETKIVIGVTTLLISFLFPKIRDPIMRIIQKVIGYFRQSTLNLVEDFVSLSTMLVLGKDFKQNGILNSFKKLKDYDRVKIGTTNFFKDIFEFFQKFLNHILTYFGKEKYIFYDCDNNILGSYLEDVNTFIESHSLDSHLSYDDGIALGNLEKRDCDLNKLLSSSLDRQKLYHARRSLEPYFQKKRATSWFGQSYRTEPTAIIMVGESHIGKSTVMLAMLHEVSARLLSKERLGRFKENPGSEIFSWNWERDHADGYNRQFNVVIDDIGCTRDVAGVTNNVYSASMKMINSAPYLLNMAELTSKADSYFSSEFVWMTSNREAWNLNSMFYNEAFVNRLRIGLEVKLKAGFKKPDNNSVQYDNFEHLEFNLIEFDKKGLRGPRLLKHLGGYDETRDFILSYHLKKSEKGEELREIINKFIDRGSSMRPQMKIVNEGNPQEFNDIMNGPSSRVALSTLGVFGALFFVNVKYIQPFIQGYIYKKLTYIKDNIAGISEDSYLVELPPGELSLVQTLNKKKIASHFITECTCPYCTPHILLDAIQKIGQNYNEGIFEFPQSFLNYIWVLGFHSDADISLFGQSLFYFLFRREYERLYDEEEGSRQNQETHNLPNGVASLNLLGGEEIERKLREVADNWLSTDPVPLCINVPARTWDLLLNKENYAVFIAYCCSFYIKRLHPYLEKPNFKNKLLKLVVKPPLIENIKKMVKPFMKGLAFLGGLGISILLNKCLFKSVEHVAEKYLENPLKKAYKIKGLSVGQSEYCKEDKSLGFCVRSNFIIGDKIEEAHVYMYIPNALEKLPQYFTESFDTPIDDIGFYYLPSTKQLIDIDFRKATKLELHIGLEKDGKDFIGLVINHPDVVSTSKWGELDNKKVKNLCTVSQSSSGIKSSPVKRPDSTPSFKKQSIDITKFMNGYDKSNRDIGKKVVNSNMLLLYVPNKDCAHLSLKEYEDYLKQLGRNCSILMLADRIGIINDHVREVLLYAKERGYINESHPAMLIRASDPTANPSFWVPQDKDFYCIDRFTNSDISVLKLPDVMFQSFKNIKKYFVSKDMPISENYDGVLYVPKEKMQLEINSTFFKKGSVDYDNYDNGEVWLYPLATQEGDCGSLLTINDKFSGCKKICGFHIAGNGVFRGASFPLFQEDVDAILKAFNVGGGIKIPTLDIDNEEFPVEKQMNFPYTFVAQVKIPAIPFRSRIKEAPLHDVGVVTHLPARSAPILVDGVKIIPSMNALWKNIPAKEPLSLGKLRILFQHLLQGYERVSVVDRKRTKNTFEECVLGVEEDPYYRSMTRGSSAGIPYKIDLAKVGLKGKQILFGVKEEFDLDTHGCHVLRKDVEDEIKYIKRGKKHIIPYEVSEKDECLPREKVLEGKIRLFAVNSALAGVLKRMYGGQFRSWFAHNRIYNGSAIGINVYSKDWDFMCKHLLFGKEENLKPQFIAMDVSKFDGTVSRPWMYNFYQIVCDWYGFSSEERKIQMEIFESQMHSFHIFKGKLFERVGSQSSGDEYTALLNTVLSQAYAYYAISLLINGSNNSIIHCEDFEFLHMLEDISRNVRIIALGDDIVISVRESWYWYDTVNEENLIKVYNKFGVNATTDSKDGSVYKHRYLKDITFLKRKTYYCKQMKRYIGKLDVSSIMKSVQWMRDNDPHYESYRLTLQHALEELALHEDPVFDRYVAQIRERGRERVHLNLLSYDKQWLKRACLLREDYF